MALIKGTAVATAPIPPKAPNITVNNVRLDLSISLTVIFMISHFQSKSKTYELHIGQTPKINIKAL